MNYSDSGDRMDEFRAQIRDIRKQMRAIQADTEPQPVKNYPFESADGTLTLRDLFGDKTDLYVVHNMGRSCSYCTLWADGYNGVYEHLADRAAFVVSSPDAPQEQAKLANSRHWRFPMVSHQGSTFAQDMGYTNKEEGFLPGVSVFQRDGDAIVRVSDTDWGPGDDFCSVWHFFDLLPEGAARWSPKMKYSPG